MYASDWCLPRIPCSFAAHGILYPTKYFSCDQLESLQRILDDAVENIINLSPRRVGIRLPAEDDIYLLCLVKYLSARHIKYVTFQYENN